MNDPLDPSIHVAFHAIKYLIAFIETVDGHEELGKLMEHACKARMNENNELHRSEIAKHWETLSDIIGDRYLPHPTTRP